MGAEARVLLTGSLIRESGGWLKSPHLSSEGMTVTGRSPNRVPGHSVTRPCPRTTVVGSDVDADPHGGVTWESSLQELLDVAGELRGPGSAV